jgi:hypothetical protein
MRRYAVYCGLVAAALCLAGCVERRFVVTSEPPGAIVLQDGKYLSASPADNTFVYYGKQHFTLIKEGFETLQVDQEIPAPWYEYPPFDFISENLIPWTIRDVRRLHYQLQPLQAINTEEVGRHAQELRSKAQTLGPPTPVAP